MKLKIYSFKNLLDDYNEIIKRCSLIKEVSYSVSFIPKTQIIIGDETLVYKQYLIEKQSYKNLNNQKKIELLSQFANDLDNLVQYDFVHGDINSSNVLYDGIRLNLIDLEPSFKQIKYGKKVVMSAVPLRSLNDLKNKTITLETDKIGFYLTSNPLERFEKDLIELSHIPDEIDEKSIIRIGGIISDVQYRFDKNGNKWALITLDILTKSIQVYIFNDSFNKYNEIIAEDAMCFIIGKSFNDGRYN